MGFRLALFPLFVVANLAAIVALRRGAASFFPAEQHGRINRWINLIVVVLSLPLLVFFFPSADAWLQRTPSPVLRLFFYPSTAWLATIIVCLLAAFAAGLVWGLIAVGRLLARRSRAVALSLEQPLPAAAGLSRRGLLAGAPAVLIPAVYGVAAYGSYSHLDEIEVSPEHTIPIANLPLAFDGLTIVQISDLHVGPYIREKQLQHIVSLMNQLRPGLVAITGDVLDRHLSSLPDAVSGLSGIRAELGAYAVLGNHDYYADRYSYTRVYRGGVHIANGLQFIGIQTLRNQVVRIGSEQDHIALLGLDWLTASDRNFFSYKPEATRSQLARMMEESEPGVPRILLAHHPDTFQDTPPEISLTLSGHTHGGGQVILGRVAGVPIGLATLRFKYISGLYQQPGRSLYVNRGIGYLGLPIRINCPPEISRFKLIRSA